MQQYAEQLECSKTHGRDNKSKIKWWSNTGSIDFQKSQNELEGISQHEIFVIWVTAKLVIQGAVVSRQGSSSDSIRVVGPCRLILFVNGNAI